MRSGHKLFLGFAVLGAACGTRTGLLTDETSPLVDAGQDGPINRDSSRRDVEGVDVDLDSLPGFDATKPDVIPPNDCPDAGSTLVYLITAATPGVLLSFYPPTLGFTTIGSINCPGAGMATPFSMAVDRKGTAYTVFSNGRLYKVSTATASCTATSFKVNQSGFNEFGMGFVADTTGDGSVPDQLFVSQYTFGGTSKGLASVDVGSFLLSPVGLFSPSLGEGCELTGTGDGRLFGFWTNNTGSGSHIAQIDKTTAKITGVDNLKAGSPNNGYAFAFWGGDFWVFLSGGGKTNVTKFDPMTSTESAATTYAGDIVGAGVSTCAPQ